LSDKFELVCADIFDDTFEISEKVDCVCIVYAFSTFVNTYETLVEFFRSAKRHMKPETGCIMITDFSYFD